MRKARVLTDAEEQLAFEQAIEGKPLRETAKSLGFASLKELWEYRQRNPQFEKSLKSARDAACDSFEDDILGLTDTIDDAKLARVKLEALCRVLAFRNPARYGAKVELNVNQTVDLSAALRAAEARLLPQMPDIEIKPNDFEHLK